ncbi:unnamed protein product, partial [Allacma fusca]
MSFLSGFVKTKRKTSGNYDDGQIDVDDSELPTHHASYQTSSEDETNVQSPVMAEITSSETLPPHLRSKKMKKSMKSSKQDAD